MRRVVINNTSVSSLGSITLYQKCLQTGLDKGENNVVYADDHACFCLICAKMACTYSDANHGSLFVLTSLKAHVTKKHAFPAHI